MFNFLKKPELLDNESTDWLIKCFEWALANFDANVFFHETRLVKPDNKDFPGAENSAEKMAHMIFEQVSQYAGMSHWPITLKSELDVSSINTPERQIEGPLRGKQGILQTNDDSQNFVVTYHPYSLNDPEVLIASYAHALAYYLSLQAKEPPPGGSENLAHAAEVLAVFSGFGIIMANSANTRKVRSCGSCSGPAIERMNFLSQYETCYALAIFVWLKNIDKNDVKRNLKKPLRPFFNNAMKELEKKKPFSEKFVALENQTR